jgi:alkylhydroperoxidase/carboxymuconolactone decarboxylase family protein YurZ
MATLQAGITLRLELRAAAAKRFYDQKIKAVVGASQTIMLDRHLVESPKQWSHTMSSNTQPINLLQSIPHVFESLTQVHVTLDHHDLPASLKHLIHLRASQINQCGFCVKMHTREAR